MLKKIFSFLGIIVPFGANAVTYPGGFTDWAPASGPVGGGTQTLSGIYTVAGTMVDGALVGGEAIVISSGNGITLTPDATYPATQSGINLDVGGLYIGRVSSADGQSGDIEALVGISKDFTIKTNGDIYIGGMTSVADGYTLAIDANPDFSGTYDVTLGASAAGVTSLAGGLTIKDANNVVTQAIETATNLDIAAADIKTGAVTVNSGNVNMGAVDIDLAQLQIVKNDIAAEQTVNIAAKNSLDFGAQGVQNKSSTAAVRLTVSDGALTSVGNIENNGADMYIKANSVTVDGTMLNDAGSKFTLITDGNWTVNGGNATPGADIASMVVAGDFLATVDGTADFKNGLVVKDSDTTAFSLTAGKLTFGSLTAAQSADMLAQLFDNTATNFSLKLNDDNLVANNIVNGAGATMNLAAINVNATSITNNGTLLDIDATNSIVTTSDVLTVANTTTDINAGGDITVGGVLTNNATSTLTAKNITLNSVANEGILTVHATPADAGTIHVTNDVSSGAGEIVLDAFDVDIDGQLLSSGGTTTVQTAEKLSVGTLTVDDGVVNLNVDDVTVTAGATVGANGTLNFGADVAKLTVMTDLNVTGDIAFGSATGNMNVLAPAFTIDANRIISTGIKASGTYNTTFNAATIDINGDVVADNSGTIVFGTGAAQSADISGMLDINDNARVTVNANAGTIGSDGATGFKVGGLNIDKNAALVAYVDAITATGDIDVDGALDFDGSVDGNGLKIAGDTSANISARDITIGGGISVGNNYSLILNSGDAFSVLDGGVINNGGSLTLTSTGAATFGGAINNHKLLSITGKTVELKSGLVSDGTSVSLLANGGDLVVSGAIDNQSGTMTIIGHTGDGSIKTGDIANAATLIMTDAGGLIESGAIKSNGGTMVMTADRVVAESLTAGAAATTTLNTGELYMGSGDLTVGGNIVHGSGAGTLVLGRDMTLTAGDMTINGALVAGDNSVIYNIDSANVTGALSIASGADLAINSIGAITFGDGVNNQGNLAIKSTNNGNISFGGDFVNRGVADIVGTGNVVINGALNNDNGGSVNLIAGGSANTITMTELINRDGTVNIARAGTTTMTGAFDIDGTLYQGNNAILSSGDVNIGAYSHTINAASIDMDSINQLSGQMTLYTSALNVRGDISAHDLTVIGAPNTWLTVDVDNGGSISGGTKFHNVFSMNVAGDYNFDNNSYLSIAAFAYPTTVGGTSNANYWATISLMDDGTLGQITNAADAKPLISVENNFVSSIKSDALGNIIGTPGMGLVLRDVVDTGTAIWLMQADELVTTDLTAKIRNLDVKFCNDDGSICVDYLAAKDANNGTDSELPVYISMRDTDGDGVEDSMYIVFDPRFGGPVEVYKLQPVVADVPNHTSGEYTSAGALDNMIAAQVKRRGFNNRVLENVIPAVFADTNLATMAGELYNRMEYYDMTFDGTGLARFSRLFQPREIEQIMANINLNEHTSFRTFEDRMMDEFIWNRNRNLNKGWADFDMGFYTMDARDNKTIDGNRFAVSAGYDWQTSETLMVGLTARVSHTSGSNSDAMDLGYRPGETIAGRVDIDVSDTDIGVGAYLTKTLGHRARLYGNAFADLHLLDVSREQNFVSDISGDGTAFSLISEWGLMHDLLNQYIVGNAYVRVGYNFGFDLTEKSAGSDYMHMESDGYAILTPGYTLMAQKRIYPSAWLQIRPYAAIGMEYDVLGMPDDGKYRFAPANRLTTYDIDVNPLWLNIGGGVEVLSALGVQFGADYRYQYNDTIQMHNIRISGSYRF